MASRVEINEACHWRKLDPAKFADWSEETRRRCNNFEDCDYGCEERRHDADMSRIYWWHSFRFVNMPEFEDAGVLARTDFTDRLNEEMVGTYFYEWNRYYPDECYIVCEDDRDAVFLRTAFPDDFTYIDER
jgi:hypothetical protein